MKRLIFYLYCFFLLFAAMVTRQPGQGTGQLPVKQTTASQTIPVQDDEVDEKQTTESQTITIQNEELDGRYYFSVLQEDDRECYKEILQGIQKMDTEIAVSIADSERIEDIYKYVLCDFPEIFWCTGKGTIRSSQSILSKQLGLYPEYAYSSAEKEKMQAEIDAVATSCFDAYHPTKDSEYERIKYVYEYLIRSVDYDVNAPDNQNLYSALVGKKSVCAGYAKATQYLLGKMGIFCTYVTGTSNGGGHAWNLVQCEGKYYYVDTTWGDPVYQNEGGGVEIPEELRIRYDYLCCNDEELFRTHKLDDGLVMPSCDSLDANYYVRTGNYYENYDAKTVQNKLYEDIVSGASISVFKFSSQEAYEAAAARVIETDLRTAAKSAAAKGAANMKYAYQKDPKLNKIVIYYL